MRPTPDEFLDLPALDLPADCEPAAPPQTLDARVRALEEEIGFIPEPGNPLGYGISVHTYPLRDKISELKELVDHLKELVDHLEYRIDEAMWTLGRLKKSSLKKS